MGYGVSAVKIISVDPVNHSSNMAAVTMNRTLEENTHKEPIKQHFQPNKQ